MIKPVNTGFLLDDEQTWRSMPVIRADQIVGQWLEEGPGFQQRRTIFSRSKKQFMQLDTPTGMIGTIPLKMINEGFYQGLDADAMIYKIDQANLLRVYTASNESITVGLRPFAESFPSMK